MSGQVKVGSPKAVYRVLVVDDYPDAAEIACLLLSVLGHECRAAHSGREALDLIGEFEPDIVVLDIGLPDMSGYDVARTVRSKPNGHRTCLVALTGWGRPDDRDRSLAAGFDEHILKPLDSAKLAKVVGLLKAARSSKTFEAACA